VNAGPAFVYFDMPLARARCAACTLPLGDPPNVPLVVRCARCALPNTVPFTADGQPADFDAAFPAMRLAMWFGAARLAMASGTPGVAVGVCSQCASPLLVSSRDPVSLPCPHCKEPHAGAAADVLVDQWPEPWARVEGGGIDLEYRLALLDDAGVTAGCAACGAPTPGDDPATRCRRCNAVTWVERAEGAEGRARRVQLGVRINGVRGDRPFNVVVPIAQGEAMLRSDASLGSSDRSGKNVLGFTGVGCAIAVALFLLLWGGIFLAIYLHR
jgi:hypothetical protein